MKRPAVLIVEDHELMAQGLRRMLEPACRVAGIAHDGEHALPMVEQLSPDVVLLDLSLPGRTGMEVLLDLVRIRPGLPVVIVTMHIDRILADMALRLGARAFVPKNAPTSELHRAITTALRGESYISPLVPVGTRRPPRDRPLGFLALSGRQQEIVRLLGQGLSTDEIAARLGSSPWTVHTHRKAIRRRLGLKSDWEMIRYALLVSEFDREQAGAVKAPPR